MFKAIAPRKTLSSFSVMDLFATSVWKLEVVATVNAPVSVIASPDVALKLPSIVDVPSCNAVVPLSMVTLPPLMTPKLFVVKVTSPVIALVPSPNVIA